QLVRARRHRPGRVPHRRGRVLAPAVSSQPEDGPRIDGDPLGPPGFDTAGPRLHAAHVSVERAATVPSAVARRSPLDGSRAPPIIVPVFHVPSRAWAARLDVPRERPGGGGSYARTDRI